MKNEIILVGGGGHCKSVIDVIELEGRFKIFGIIDKSSSIGSSILGYPVIGNDSDLPNLKGRFKYALVTIGQIKSPALRIKLFNLLYELKFTLPNIISPKAYVSKHASLGKGIVIMHNVIINANSKIGDNCIINSKALIEHDCLVAKHCHISTSAIINGGVKIKTGCFIGSNSTIKEMITIKKNSIISAGNFVK